MNILEIFKELLVQVAGKKTEKLGDKMSDKSDKPEETGGGDLFADLFFHLLLNRAEERVKNATGDTRDDYMYDQAESVRRADIKGYAYATFKGVEYGPIEVTWGPLDADKEKSTVLIQTREGKWVKLWFFDKDLNPT